MKKRGFTVLRSAALLVIVLTCTANSAEAQYRYGELPLLRNELTFGYSYASSFKTWAGGLMHTIPNTYMVDPNKFQGSVILSYGSMMNPKLSVLGTIGVTRFTGWWYTVDDQKRRDFSNTVVSLMAGLKYYYIKTDYFRVYTRLDAGFAFTNIRRTLKGGDKDKSGNTTYSLNFAPVGIQVGYTFVVYGEWTFGTIGMFTVGVAYRW